MREGVLTGPLTLTENIKAFKESIKIALNNEKYDDALERMSNIPNILKYESKH